MIILSSIADDIPVASETGRAEATEPDRSYAGGASNWQIKLKNVEKCLTNSNLYVIILLALKS